MWKPGTVWACSAFPFADRTVLVYVEAPAASLLRAVKPRAGPRKPFAPG